MSPPASLDEPNLSSGDTQDSQQGRKNQSEAISMVEDKMLKPLESDSLRDNEPFWEQSEEGQAGETNSRCHFLRQEDNLRPHLRQSTRNRKLPACCWTYLQMLPNLEHVGRCKTMWEDMGGTHSDIHF